MDTLKILIAVMKRLGRSNPLFEYKINGQLVTITAYTLHGVPYGDTLEINPVNYLRLDDLLDSWMANQFKN